MTCRCHASSRPPRRSNVCSMDGGRKAATASRWVLQGGGALGAYQADVYQALHESGIEPDWVSGVSIGAINAAIIAGNVPDRRLSRLRTFWELITDRKIWPFTVLAGARATAELLDVVWNYFMRSGCSRLSTASGLA
jgi:predicted acylesterase/phospholipase RssA